MILAAFPHRQQQKGFLKEGTLTFAEFVHFMTS